MSTQPYFYNIVKDDGENSSATVFADGQMLVADASHPRFKEIIGALVTDAPFENIEALLDISRSVERKFQRLSDRVTIEHGSVFFDGDPLEGPFVSAIVRFHDEGNEDFQTLVNFLDKLGQNPNSHSVKHLARWMGQESFALAADGDIIGYKAVYSDGDDGYYPRRFSVGVRVNDEPVEDGHRVLQKVGDVVTMARSEVEFDPAVPCSRGLHVGTWGYARSFGPPKVIEVKISPRDVVSVPTDCGDQKMRTCRYEVLAEVSAPRTALYTPAPSEDDEPIDLVVITLTKDFDTEAPQAAPAGPASTDYAEYRKADFKKVSRNVLRSVAKAWKVNAGGSKDDLVKRLSRKAGDIRWNRQRRQGFQG